MKVSCPEKKNNNNKKQVVMKVVPFDKIAGKHGRVPIDPNKLVTYLIMYNLNDLRMGYSHYIAGHLRYTVRCHRSTPKNSNILKEIHEDVFLYM